jgi:peptidoglycan/xylan/chitin deacetylase (PgdA/CDA1 family)
MKNALIVTIDVEEWYHSSWFDIDKLTPKPPSFCREELTEALKFLKELKVQATFFVLAEVAEKIPDLIEQIAQDDHEVACHGFYHNSYGSKGEAEQRWQMLTAKSFLERILHQRIYGFRSPNFRNIDPASIRALEKTGYLYDSSVVPCLPIPGWYGTPKAPLFPYQPNNGSIWEVPVAVCPYLRVPAGGGWFLRNMGATWVRFAANVLRKNGPITLYLHPWELSNHACIKGVPFHVFRRTGTYVKSALKSLINDFGGQTQTVRDYVSTL